MLVFANKSANNQINSSCIYERFCFYTWYTSNSQLTDQLAEITPVNKV